MKLLLYLFGFIDTMDIAKQDSLAFAGLKLRLLGTRLHEPSVFKENR
jgi:hypothetical protein